MTPSSTSTVLCDSSPWELVELNIVLLNYFFQLLVKKKPEFLIQEQGSCFRLACRPQKPRGSTSLQCVPQQSGAEQRARPVFWGSVKTCLSCWHVLQYLFDTEQCKKNCLPSGRAGRLLMHQTVLQLAQGVKSRVPVPLQTCPCMKDTDSICFLYEGSSTTAVLHKAKSTCRHYISEKTEMKIIHAMDLCHDLHVV